jgi:hypothetical protein
MNNLSKVAYWLFDPVVAMGWCGGVFRFCDSCGGPAENTSRKLRAKIAPKAMFSGIFS